MREVRKFDVWSVTQMSAVLYALMGLFLGVLMAGMSAIGAGIASQAAGSPMPGLQLFFGMGAMIFLPIFYGLFGAIMAAFTTWLYNVVAKRIGGIRIDLSDD